MRTISPITLLVSAFFFLTSITPVISQCASGETLNTYCLTNGVVINDIGFEFCPDAGKIAQSTITAGTLSTVVALPENLMNVTVYEGTSGSGTSGTIVYGPENSNSTTLEGTQITASAANLCLTFVFTNGVGIISCEGGFDVEMSVCSRSLEASTVTFIALNDLCETAGVQTGLSGGTPTGGVYSGSGVTDDGNGMTYSFNPATAGAGNITITYTNGGSDSDDVTVVTEPSVSFNSIGSLCVDDDRVNLTGASPSGGTFSGTGVVTVNSFTQAFNPQFAGIGTHTITYTEPGVCGATTTQQVEVTEACGCTGGLDSFFFCGGASTETDLVVFEICPDSGMAAKATIEAGTFDMNFGNTLTVYEGDMGSGTSGTIVFGPSSGDLMGSEITGLGADKCLIFVSNNPTGTGCIDGFETGLKVCGESIAPSIALTALDDLCISEGVQTNVTGGFPTGGVYSGPGVTDNGNGMTYSFDPSVAGVGTHTITYTESSNSVTDDVEVFNIGTLGCTMFTALADLCIDAGVQTGLGSGSPIGGVYSGSGVTDDGNGMTYSFNPSTAGVGMSIISYTVGDNTVNDTVEIFGLPTVTFSVDFVDQCVSNSILLSTFQGQPTGGVYSGPGVTDIGTGIGYTFNPSDAGLGTHTITYTFTDTNGCSNSSTDTVEVFGPSVTLNLPVDICSGGNGGLPVGGVYSGTGVTDDGNGTSFTFDAVTAGAGQHTISYSFTDGGGCTNTAIAIYEDVVDPTINCVNDFIVMLNSGNASITANDVVNSTSDNCGVSNIVLSQDTFTMADLGTFDITATVTDFNNNSAFCTISITVEEATLSTAILSSKQQENVTIFPNPVNEIMNVSVGFKTLEIYNLEGDLVFESITSPVDISVLTPGVYFALVKTETDLETVLKFLKK